MTAAKRKRRSNLFLIYLSLFAFLSQKRVWQFEAPNRTKQPQQQLTDHQHDSNNTTSTRTTDFNNNLATASSSSALRHDGSGFAHCFYRANYDSKNVNTTTGKDDDDDDNNNHLPMIVAEVFATHDHTFVNVLVESHLDCHDEDEHVHNFYSNATRNVTFGCLFEQDGSRTTSKPVHPKAVKHMAYVLIQCPLPEHLRPSLPMSGSKITRSFLTLVEEEGLSQRVYHHNDLPTSSWQNESNHVNDHEQLPPPSLPRELRHLPICSHAWPLDEEDTPQPYQQQKDTQGVVSQQPTKKKNKISLMTRISLKYERGLDGEWLSIPPIDIVAWLEYHIAIGIDHLYIYDDSPNVHNSTIRQLCQPYVQQGLLTYIYYPKRDLHCTNGKRLYSAQFLAANGALRHYESETEWMGHWDVDEYLVIEGVHDQRSLHAFIDANDNYGNDVGATSGSTNAGQKDTIWQQLQRPDEISFARLTYGECNNTKRNLNMAPHQDDKHDYYGNTTKSFPLSLFIPPGRKQCIFNRTHNIKGIFRTSNVLFLRVHDAFLRMDNQRALPRKQIPAEKAHMAHFREGRAAGTLFPARSHSFDEWIHVLEDKMRKRFGFSLDAYL
ncbi:hypothetical protein ACA910_012387 [Epithemia clementina (nom. ined.)]